PHVCVVVFLIGPPPRSTLFPYTTLFRSWWADPMPRPEFASPAGSDERIVEEFDAGYRAVGMLLKGAVRDGSLARAADQGKRQSRSEEHTSELQSRGHLVCRLLLEKKKKR